MKATLTIEVPDDFKKGQCEKCQFGFDEDIMFETEYECSIVGCTADNCPLEIQKACEQCAHFQELSMFDNSPKYDGRCQWHEHAVSKADYCSKYAKQCKENNQ